jgi:hypothetical protein
MKNADATISAINNERFTTAAVYRRSLSGAVLAASQHRLTTGGRHPAAQY